MHRWKDSTHPITYHDNNYGEILPGEGIQKCYCALFGGDRNTMHQINIHDIIPMTSS